MGDESTCPQRHRHTKAPVGYLDWHAWAERKARTHRQVQCPGCGRWAIWRRLTTPARAPTR